MLGEGDTGHKKFTDIFSEENLKKKKPVFILADYFKKLSPSDCYDLSVRLMDNF